MASTEPTRDANGRFLPGSGGGPGRPRGNSERALQEAFRRAFSGDDMQAITFAMIGKAKAGSIAAAKLLFEYGIGKPAIRVSFDDPDEGLRVAGLTPADVIVDRIAKLRACLQERLVYEDLIARGEQPAVEPIPEVELAGEPLPTTPVSYDSFELVDVATKESAIRKALKAGIPLKAISSVHDVSPQEIHRIADEMKMKEQGT